MPVELTVLSVRQPWASLMVSGEKWCENRSWKSDYRGPLWIHASSKLVQAECELWGIDPAPLVTSAIVGCVDLVDIVAEDDLEERLPELVERFGLNDDVGPEFIEGPFCWIVTNPRPLMRPVPVKGKLRLWTHRVDSQLVADLTAPAPLIVPGTRPADPYADEEDDAAEADGAGGVSTAPPNELPAGDAALSVTKKVLVDGKRLTVDFTPGRDCVSMYFRGNGNSRIARGPDSYQYVDGKPEYRAGCEMAWKLFPECFANPTHELWRAKKADGKEAKDFLARRTSGHDPSLTIED